MKKFKAQMTNVVETLINGQTQKWLTCEVSLSSLIEAKRKLGKELFSVNVKNKKFRTIFTQLKQKH